MRVAFCSTCQGRAHHLARTLPANLAGNPDALFVLLDYGSDDNFAEFVQEHAMHILDSRIVYYKLENPGPFRMAHAKNLAHRLAIFEGAEVLVNLDADNYAGTGFASYAREHFSEHPQSFLWARMIPGILTRGVSGRIALKASTFVKCGGYDESRYNDWGPDDKDLNTRLQRMGYEATEIPARYLAAIKHDDRVRFRAYPHARPQTSEYPVEIPAVGTVVNSGRFGCATVFRNFSPVPITLAPIPTRIFGIGWHKTGTTSLASALAVLGYDTAHWVSPRWARNIHEEMQTGKSKTLEASYALTDFPIPLLYQQLDQAYPGSKFILTLRPEGEWLASVKKHFSERNPWRRSWDIDAFTHKVHSIAYGRGDFDESAMLERYRRHNRQVMAYFAHRPHDLLVMEKPDWHDLCAFLGKPIPSLPYPKENATP